MSPLRQFPEADSPRRKSPCRATKATILIVGEGKETEPNYLHGLKMEDPISNRFSVTVKKGKGGSRVQIIHEAINRKNDRGKEYDETWCVMDVEELSSESSRKDLSDALALARENGVQVCVSNPSFEVWFLSHFVRSCRSFTNCDAVVEALHVHWKATFNGLAYRKTDGRVYSRLRDRTPAALKNASDVRVKDHDRNKPTEECNSSTDMLLLVGKLLGDSAIVAP